MLTNKSLQEVMAAISPSIQTKLNYSISLLKKAENLAFRYDPEGYVLAFSGGKDSQALFHVAQLAGVRFQAQMNCTSIDPPEVIRFVRRKYPEVQLIAPDESIFSAAVRMKSLPTASQRWCCAQFKELKTPGKVTLIGIRHAESNSRKKRNEVEISSRKFSGTLDELDDYRESLKNRKWLRKARITIEPNGEQVISCIHGKETLLISPIIHWTDTEVWEFLNACGVPHCELYDQGYTRIGCILCPMSSRKQHLKEIERWPHVKRNWLKAIREIRRRGGITRRNWLFSKEPYRNLGGGRTPPPTNTWSQKSPKPSSTGGSPRSPTPNGSPNANSPNFPSRTPTHCHKLTHPHHPHSPLSPIALNGLSALLALLAL